MRNSFKLAVSYIRYYKKQAVVLLVGICMSVLLLNGISSLIYSNRNADYKHAKEEYGSWHYAIAVSENLAEKSGIRYRNSDFDLRRMGYAILKEWQEDSIDLTFCYGDENYLAMTGRRVLEGEYPRHPQEIALDYYALHNLEVDASLGSTLKWMGTEYTLTGILSEGTKTDSDRVMAFAGERTVRQMEGEQICYLEFSDQNRVYEQFSTFLESNQLHLSDWQINDGIAEYVGAEAKESVIDIVRTACHLKKGRLIYLLGTLDKNMNLLQKMIFAVLFIFGVFIIYSIYQVIIERRTAQYGILEVLGIEEKSLFASMLTELLLLFFPAYAIGSLLGNALARALYRGEFKIDMHALWLGFALYLIFLWLCCVTVVRTMRRYSQIEKMKKNPAGRSRRIVCLRRHNVLGVVSRRFVLARRRTFAGIIFSLSLGGVLFICTTYVADSAMQNNIHSMQTDEGLHSDICVSIDDDDLGKVIPKEIVRQIREGGPDGIKKIFPISYTLGEIPLRNGIFKWTEFYPEVAENPDEEPDQELMEKYNGIATKQGRGEYKLKVNVYGYEDQQLSDLSEYLLEGSIDPASMSANNQVVLKTLMDGAGYYDGIDIHPGDHITLKVPGNPVNSDPEIVKFLAEDDNYVEKDFVVAAVVSRCVGETKEFIGAGSGRVGVILPQSVMESSLGVADYNNLNIDLDKSVDSEKFIRELRTFIKGLQQCIIHDNTVDIDQKNALLMKKMYFFYGIAVILFFISLLHTINSMKHQIQSRRYEIGILRAMGMTEQGFRSMLLGEGLFYGLTTSFCMVVLTVLCQNILFRIMQHVIRYIIVNSAFPMFPCILMAIVNVAVCEAAMFWAGRRLLRETIVEEIR